MRILSTIAAVALVSTLAVAGDARADAPPDPAAVEADDEDDRLVRQVVLGGATFGVVAAAGMVTALPAAFVVFVALVNRDVSTPSVSLPAAIAAGAGVAGVAAGVGVVLLPFLPLERRVLPTLTAAGATALLMALAGGAVYAFLGREYEGVLLAPIYVVVASTAAGAATAAVALAVGDDGDHDDDRDDDDHDDDYDDDRP